MTALMAIPIACIVWTLTTQTDAAQAEVPMASAGVSDPLSDSDRAAVMQAHPMLDRLLVQSLAGRILDPGSNQQIIYGDGF